MKPIRLTIIGLLLFAATSMYGLSSFFEVSVGGGWSSLGYGLTNATQPGLTMSQGGSYGLGAHVGYGLQFNKYVGLGVGVDLSRYGANARISGVAEWQGVRDTDGELYNHLTTVHKWSDQQELYMLEIPLAVYLRFPVATDVRLYGQIGAKACIPMMNKGSYGGTLSHEGFYEPWMMTLSNIPNHGFYTASMEGEYELKTKMTVAAFVKIGVEAPVDELRHVWIFGAIYGTMHFMPALETAETAVPLGWRNDTQGNEMRQAHYFMSDYAPVYNTQVLSGKPSPIAVGAEIGIRIRIPHPKRYRSHCMCEEE